jgi:hypothetical protein
MTKTSKSGAVLGGVGVDLPSGAGGAKPFIGTLMAPPP